MAEERPTSRRGETQRGAPLDLLSAGTAWLLLKGMAMGIAEVVPGVSGGTVAYVTGIYERLLHAINSFSPELLNTLRRDGAAAAWIHLDGNFLAVLFGGMALSVFSFAHVMGYLLAQHPIAVWSFFFGVIIASSWLMVAQVRNWSVLTGIALLAGIAAGVLLSNAIPVELEATLPILFVAGAFAVCAWILPGVSGSYIMLVLGLYATVIEAISALDLAVLAVLAAGCATGLLTFARLLERMLKRYHEPTLTLLTGFMIGSLIKVWPWKHTLSYQLGSSGRRLPLVQEPVLPHVYRELTGSDPQVLLALLLVLCAVALVAGLWLWARRGGDAA